VTIGQKKIVSRQVESLDGRQGYAGGMRELLKPEGSDKQGLTFKSSEALPTGIFSRPAVLQRLKSNASFQ
jgi:hypothetical protein